MRRRRARPGRGPALTGARSAVVTGASGGLGAAIALRLAGPGVQLGLTGRDAGRLEAAAERCRGRGARVMSAALDVREADAMADWLRAVDDGEPVDLVVANAGVAGGGGPGRIEPAATARDVFDVNLGGALNALSPVIPRLVARGRGRLVLVSSLAAIAPLPDYPAYSASKAALLAYGLALRGSLRPHGVGVTVACPGFVATPMADGYRGRRPFEVRADAAARRILDGAARDRAVVSFPMRLAVLARLGSAAPEALRRWGMAALGGDPG